MVKGINGGDGDNYFKIPTNNTNVGKTNNVDKKTEIEIPIGRTNSADKTTYPTGKVDIKSSDPIINEQVELLANNFNSVSENYADSYNYAQKNLPSNPEDLYLPISQNDTAYQIKYGNLEYDANEAFMAAV